MLYWFFVCLLATAPKLNAVKTTFVDLGSVSGGPVVLHGHVLTDSLFRIEAKVTVSGSDTTWHGLFINGLAVDLPDPPRPTNIPPYIRQRMEFDRQVRVAKDRFLETSRRFGKMPTRRESIEFMAEEYRRSPLVERVRVLSDDEFEVCYRGDEDCERNSLSAVANVTPSRSELLPSAAQRILRFLRDGRMVFIRRGQMFFPALGVETARYRSEIAALQNGKPAEQSIFPDKRFAHDIQRPPVTLEVLKRGGEER